MDNLLTTSEVAQKLQVNKGTLRNWRHKKKGPPFIKLETGAIRYYEKHVENWIWVEVEDPNAEDKAYETMKQREVDGWK